MKKSCIKASIIVLITVFISLSVMPISVFAEESDTSEALSEVQTNSEGNERYYLGETIKAGDDDGYDKDKTIKKKDPHYGWTLGDFYITGFSRVIAEDEETPVFLKNVGDTPTLYFKLNQDIDELDGDDDNVIYDDPNGYDKYFGTDKTDFGKGALIIRHTDYQNHVGDPVIYTDYLSGVEEGADTKVELLEEGDYEASLDYTVRHFYWRPFDAKWISNDNDYKIFFKFSVRNGNCMVFPFDTETKAELTNTSITPNGFYLDLAKSKYLDITIKREILAEGAEGLTEDVRFNRPAKDGDKYTEEGIYTIKVHNRYTDEDTTKKIYVGNDDILKAYMTSGLSIQEIKNQVANGAKVSADGILISQIETISDTKTNEKLSETETTSAYTSDENSDNSSDKSATVLIVIIVISTLVVGCVIIILVKSKSKRNDVADKKGGDEV